MNNAIAVASPARAARLSSRASFFLLASIVVTFLAGSSAPTPLYAVYAAEWGFSPITVTVIFGIYALAVLGSLLTVGSLSDYVGRRPVLFVTISMQMVAMILFATATSVTSLLVARTVQGLSAGAAISAIGAGMLDFDRVRGPTANSVAPMIGSGSGGLLSGLFVLLFPAPTVTVYVFLLAIFIAQLVGVLLMPETAPRRAGALKSLRPQLNVPPQVRHAVLVATPLLAAAWALAGFYGSVGPAFVRKLAGSTSVLLGGVGLGVLAFSGVATVVALNKSKASTLLLTGGGSIAIGSAITLVAIRTSSLPLFFVGLVISGCGFGTSTQGAIRSVIPFTPAEHRAGTLSVIFLVSYVSMGGPAVGAGARIVYGGGLMHTARDYASIVIVLAIAALIGTLVRLRIMAGRTTA